MRRGNNLTDFHEENPILWNIADPKYRNKIKRSLVKVKLVAPFVWWYVFRKVSGEKFPLSKNFNDTRVKKSAKKRIETEVLWGLWLFGRTIIQETRKHYSWIPGSPEYIIIFQSQNLKFHVITLAKNFFSYLEVN